MGNGELRALVLETNLAEHGVDATVTPTGSDSIVTRGIWVTPTAEDVPSGLDFQRREPRRVMALSRDAVPRLPTGSRISAPERDGGPVRDWRVDGIERDEADHRRVIVIEDPDEDT
jgi:hypothetical protein